MNGFGEIGSGYFDAAEASDARHWEPPQLDASRPPTAAKLESLEQAAWDEGYKRGREEGRAGAREAARPQVQALQAVIDSFDHPLACDTDAVAEALSELALQIASRLAATHLTAHPETLRTIAEQALALLGEQRAPVRIRVAPSDLEAIRALAEDTAVPTRLVADNNLSPGDIMVDSNPLSVDARLATRVQQLAAEWRPQPQ
ncbi:hypothetical protein JN531_011010 [Flagellatimonas centrodinii]|uniref:FliH/SctL family protein n=1 Tax=Flagellatimonas centrodinii TaxID=2806210 RepID=UPI001FEE7CC5|nr:FliH/SctL family protein [Flagellatimonas centrodinii]ULQ45643.1 hypothetical protein JN531_011010 [Flagellatimonas centrodinii]